MLMLLQELAERIAKHLTAVKFMWCVWNLYKPAQFSLHVSQGLRAKLFKRAGSELEKGFVSGTKAP